MKNIIIFGGGSSARVIFSELVGLKKFKIIGFLDNYSKKGKVIETFKGKNYKNLGKISEIRKINKTVSGVIGVGDNYIRQKICSEVFKHNKNFRWETVIAKTAIISHKVKIGKGSVLMPNVVINTGTKIGEHCLINTSSSIDHDNIFRDFSSTGPGVITSGHIRLGKYSHIGVGAIVKHGISIGDNTIIGGNSFVNKICKNNYVYFGNPTKKIKRRKIGEKYL